MTADPATPDAPDVPDVSVSPELFAPVSTGMTLCYQTFGDPSGEPMLLVMGLGTQMTYWDPEFCSMLARRGYFVIRFDNRDVGRSSRGTGKVSLPVLVRTFAQGRGPAPYSMSDLAADGFALLDHLEIDSAHVVGVSMGGMIAQTMAIAEPARVRSLTSIMSTTGKRTVGWQHPSVMPALLRPIKPGREAYVAHSAAMWSMIGSPGFARHEDRTRELAGEAFDRGVSGEGSLRQMMAILTQPNRSPDLHRLRMPTLVVHGLADKLVHVSGGRATAAAIPGAELLLVPGMGHDLPPEIYPAVVDAIARTASRART